MTLRDHLHRLIDQLPDDDLADVRHLLETLRAQESAAQVLARDRNPRVEAWQEAAIRVAVEYANRSDSEWVSHQEVAAWLRSWGTSSELPLPAARRRV